MEENKIKETEMVSLTGSLAIPCDTLRAIQQTAIQANGALDKLLVIRELPDPYHWGTVNSQGELTLHPKSREVREHVLHSVGEIGAYVDYAHQNLGMDPVIWISVEGVTIVLNDETDELRYQDTVDVVFEKTEQFLKLQAADSVSGLALDQKGFVRLLRMTFIDALGGREQAERIIRACRSIKFVETASGRASVQNGRESLGREFESELAGTEEPIPDLLEFSVCLFKDPALQVPVRIVCDLEIDIPTQRFMLRPLSGQIDAAKEEVLSRVKEICEATEQPVFLGSP